MNVILASSSPRRHELLQFVCPKFDIIPADIDETIPDDIPVNDVAEYLANKKALHICSQYPDSIVIGCDTVVIIDNMILGKPVDENDCKNMLKKLSNRTHFVITGVSICKNGYQKNFSEITKVTFYPLSDNDIMSYINTKEPFDKAGGYGIQAYGALLVKEICGDFFNVVGLPIARLNRELKNFY